MIFVAVAAATDVAVAAVAVVAERSLLLLFLLLLLLVHLAVPCCFAFAVVDTECSAWCVDAAGDTAPPAVAIATDNHNK